jgi:hypothetical protein
MHREVIALMLALAAIATSAGCGSAGTGSGCSNVEADLKGIYAYSKRQLVEHHTLSPSELQARERLQLKAREALAACAREGRVKKLPQQHMER